MTATQRLQSLVKKIWGHRRIPDFSDTSNSCKEKPKVNKVQKHNNSKNRYNSKTDLKRKIGTILYIHIKINKREN